MPVGFGEARLSAERSNIPPLMGQRVQEKPRRITMWWTEPNCCYACVDKG